MAKSALRRCRPCRVLPFLSLSPYGRAQPLAEAPTRPRGALTPAAGSEGARCIRFAGRGGPDRHGGLEASVMRSPSSVSVITAEDIAHKGARSVGDLLSDVPGVFVEERGIERIRIRGQSARHVAILINGQKPADHTGYGQPVMINLGSILRIGVVRGPSSVTAGTQVIGGVLNIVTKKGQNAPFAGEAGLAGFLATGGYRATLGFSGQQGSFDRRLGLAKSRQGDRHSPFGRLDKPDTDDESAQLYLGRRHGNHYLAAQLQASGLSANVYTGEPDFSIALSRRNLRKAAISCEGQS